MKVIIRHVQTLGETPVIPGLALKVMPQRHHFGNITAKKVVLSYIHTIITLRGSQINVFYNY
jgi:hypothetical protein